MDEALKVLSRLDRIEALRSRPMPPRALLDEVRALLAEAEQWLRAEPAGGRAEQAVESVREALSRVGGAEGGGERTLVA
jgi:hypothetical protein